MSAWAMASFACCGLCALLRAFSLSGIKTLYTKTHTVYTKVFIPESHSLVAEFGFASVVISAFFWRNGFNKSKSGA